MGLATDHAYAPAAAAPSSPQPADHQALRVLLAELARSEERYALAIRAANDGIWDWDLVSNTLYLSPRWHAILARGRSRSGGVV
jgi:PAS domain-containing protein